MQVAAHSRRGYPKLRHKYPDRQLPLRTSTCPPPSRSSHNGAAIRENSSLENIKAQQGTTKALETSGNPPHSSGTTPTIINRKKNSNQEQSRIAHSLASLITVLA
eukprot:GHVR01108345.1.p1 GENE.GHVR01108345.1~~GHVR01108345.1.p1  ORF type:complete len:105 (+),score=10.28 GHVR01108345.1:651-965(+)